MSLGGDCEACNVTGCGVGQYRGACGTSSDAVCEACTTKPLNASYLTSGQPLDADNCTWTCDEGFWRSGEACVSCTTSSCAVGEYRGACAAEGDAPCVVCDPSQLPKYSHFIGSLDVHACAWSCNAGYNETAAGTCVSSVAPDIVVGQASVARIKEWDPMSTMAVGVQVSFLPDADVVVTVTRLSDEISLTGPTQLTFTPSTWNVAQTITVRAVDDSVREGNHSALVNMTVRSADERFNGLWVDPIEVGIVDNDCDALVAPAHGAVLAGCGNEYGDSCTVQCHPGHAPAGGVDLQCQAGSGEWDVAMPTCAACVEGYFMSLGGDCEACNVTGCGAGKGR